MKTEWILIANASKARLLSRESEHTPLVALQHFEHPPSRAKSSTLADDHLGHGSSDNRPGGVSFTPKLTPQRKEQLQFAHTLAQHLDEGLSHGQCNSISIFASSPFLGELKSQLTPQSLKALKASIDTDLSSYGLTELEERIDHAFQGVQS